MQLQIIDIMPKKNSKKAKFHKQQQISDKEASDPEFIGHYEQAPNYMKDNEHITHGYRIGFNTPKKILRSLFMAHNQTVNIWTHFFPAILIICVIIYLLWYFKSHQLITEFQAGKNQLYNGISSYSQALSKYAVVIKMKQFTMHEFTEIQQTLISSYSDFVQGTQIWKRNAQITVKDFGKNLKEQARKKFQKIQKLKMQFENQFVPYVMNNIINKIDPEKLSQINQKLQNIKEQLDSQNYKYLELLHQKTGVDQSISRWPVFIFLISALVCLLGSALFHLFYPMSGKAYQAFCRLDYAGINLLISGSSFPPLYYGMYCIPDVAAFYLIFIVAIGLSLFIISLFEYLHRPQNFVLKSCAYGGFGVSLIIPLTHAVINQVFYNNHGDNFSILTSVDEYFACGFCYLTGLYIYTVRCPQRKNPGKYNLCGHSHQIWHCFVVLGIVCTYFGALQNLQMRRNSTCPAQICPAMIL